MCGEVLDSFSEINVRHDNLLDRMIYPVIENEVIAHKLKDFSSSRVSRPEIWNKEWVCR